MKRAKKKISPPMPPASVPESVAPHLFLHRCILVIMAFTAGAAVMIIELAAIRILAPWFGSSLYTWTGLIGVILTAMSAGYYAGGWLADKKTSYLVLANILAAAALFICAIPLWSHVLGTPLAKYNVILGPVVASLLMFAVPGFLLGSVSPYIIRLVSLLSADKHIGLSAGTVYMVSTIGSVLGTFASGFWLIPHLDLEHVFWCTGIAVALLALLGYFLSFWQRGNPAWQSLALIVAIPALLLITVYTKPPRAAGLLLDQMSFYHRIRVTERKLQSGDGLKYLYLDTTLEGAQYDKSAAIPLPYQRYWELARVLCREHNAALFLGGGAFKVPQAFLDYYPRAHVEVVEIDPAVVSVGRRFFQLDNYPHLHIVVDDARRHLAQTRMKYDLIFGDAYNGLRSVPAHLLTREFFQGLKEHLDEHGIFMMNLVSAVQGPNSALFASVMKTLGQVFPKIYVFSPHPQKLTHFENIIIVAATFDLPLDAILAGLPPEEQALRKLLLTRVSPQEYNSDNGSLLTDRFNPVEYLVAQTIQYK
jgi:spermidine synthase